MALPVLTITVNDYPAGKDQTFSKIVVYGTIGIGAGGLYQANGLPLAFLGSEFIPIGVDQTAPVWLTLYGVAGFIYNYDPTHKSIRIFESGAAVGAFPELAGAASVTVDTLQFRAEFNKS